MTNLDVHKNSINVALADGDINGEVLNYGAIVSTIDNLDRLVKKPASAIESPRIYEGQ